MRLMRIDRLRQPGVLAALGAALLFGAGTPLAKQLLNLVDPWLLAGLLYLGSGVGLTVYRWFVRSERVRMARSEAWWFVGAIAAGGVAAPVLLMFGLVRMPASGASLLLNAEAVFTALLAWFVFKENFDRRIAIGMAAIVAGAAVLTWPHELRFPDLWPTLAIIAACFAWGVDNNLTRKVSLTDATWIASVKGLSAGVVNLVLAVQLGARMPPVSAVAGAMIIGLLAYGASLALFVIALRHLGSARTGAYFSVAPFFGALLALAMGESLTIPLACAGLLMAFGVWLHLSERHQHEHVHDALAHEHEHVHDGDPHHAHDHEEPVELGTRHSHRHQHAPLVHSHAHFPDAHHRHDH
jgi:drug/metabolite transporter (DMT)-like permease